MLSLKLAGCQSTASYRMKRKQQNAANKKKLASTQLIMIVVSKDAETKQNEMS